MHGPRCHPAHWPGLWSATREVTPVRGWPAAGLSAHCELDDAGYLTFLKDRATGAPIELSGGEIWARGPAGSVLAV